IQARELQGNAYDTAPASAAVVAAHILWPEAEFPLDYAEGSVSMRLTPEGWRQCQAEFEGQVFEGDGPIDALLAAAVARTGFELELVDYEVFKLYAPELHDDRGSGA